MKSQVPIGEQRVRMVNEFGEQVFLPVWMFHFYKRRDYLGFYAVEVVAHIPGGSE